MTKGKYDGVNPLEKLHEGEPYFFLRAQDKHAPLTVLKYADLVRRGGDLEGSKECLDMADRMQAWQQANHDLVKKPD
jgi:hypothetical protein